MDASTVTRSRTRSLFSVPSLSIYGIFGILLGCGADTTGTTTPLTPAQAYWSLRLDQKAIMMALTAPYNTVQLTVTPLNARGEALPGLGPVTYRTLDSAVAVSPTGVVVALATTQANTTARVVASLRDEAQKVTHADTATVIVTEVAPSAALTTFSMQPAPGDSAKRGLNFPNGNLPFDWPVTATNAAHDTVCGVTGCSLTTYYSSSNPSVATIDAATGRVVPYDTGHVIFTAMTLAYGVAMRDSVNFRIGPQLLALLAFTINNGSFYALHQKKIIIGVGGVVDFLNGYQFPVVNGPLAITFTHPERLDSAADLFFGTTSGNGNVAFNCDTMTNPNCYSSSNEASKARRFPVAGLYQMHYSLAPADTYEIDVLP